MQNYNYGSLGDEVFPRVYLATRYETRAVFAVVNGEDRFGRTKVLVLLC